MHFVVHDYIMLNQELTLQEKCLYSYVEGFHDNQEKTFYASNKHLSKLFNLTPRRISGIISSLVNKGYITLGYDYVNESKEIKNRFIYLNDHRLKHMKLTMESSFKGGGEKSFVGVVKKPSTNNKVVIINKNKELFESWWNLYKHKQDRASVEPKFCSLKDEEINKIMIHTKEYVKNTYLDGTYPSRRLPMTYLNKKTWENEVIEVKVKHIIKLDAYKRDTTGFPMGYCNKCGSHESYTEFDIKNGESRCCGDKINPKKKVANGIERPSCIQQSV